MAFKYRARSAEALDTRATKQGGDFQSFIKDEFRTFKVSPGDNAIRVLPATFDEKLGTHWGLDIYVHYDVGPDKASVLCPYKMYGERCPVCDERVKAERRGATEQEIRDLKTSQRVLIWLVDLKHEEHGVVYWAMPWSADRDLVKATKDRGSGQYRFIDDPDQGYDVYFDKEGEKLRTKYTAWSLAGRASGVDESWLDYIEKNPLDEILVFRDYDEIDKLFRGGAAEEEDDRPTRRGGGDGAAAEEAPARSRSRTPEPEPEDQPRSRSRTREESPEDDPLPTTRTRTRASEPDDPPPSEDQPAIRRRAPSGDQDDAPRGERATQPAERSPSTTADALRARFAAAKAKK
jgi:hypothetical protein